MRKVIPFLFLALPLVSVAQDETKKDEKKSDLPKNAVKINLSSLAFRNYHIQYERKLAKKLSMNLGFRFMPDGGLPMESLIRNYFPDIFENQYVDIGKFTASNFSITPELRWYLSRKAMKGFYIAPYARYTSFDLGLPLRYTYDQDPGPLTNNVTKTAIFNGKINSFSGGLMFGTQFSLGKRLVLDIWWLGGHFGSSNGDLDLITSLPTQEERDAVRDVIDQYKQDVKPFEYERVGPVTATGAKIQSSGPWAGIRALGINLGFRF
jgi:hypothetical protein